MADPFRTTKETHPDSVARWQAAYARALAENLMIRPNLFGGTVWTVTSRSNPELVYGTDGVRCGCKAGETGDPVCKHRALWRAVHGTLPHDVPSNVIKFVHRRSEPRPAA